jgi:hypothetical protein
MFAFRFGGPMTTQGLRRKFDLAAYLEKTSHLPSRA